jgi:hypothetical protein
MANSSLLRDLLDGERTWGSLDISSNHGVARHRLAVYPPGLARDERIALRLQRAYSVWGLGLWLVLTACLMVALTPWSAVAAATVTCLVIWAVIRMRTAGVHGTVRTMTVVRTPATEDATAVARYDEFRDHAERLVRADVRLAAGEISAVEHEAAVWRVYDRLDQH